MRPPDPAFADARLAALYDELDGARSDLPAYLALADEVGATRRRCPASAPSPT